MGTIRIEVGLKKNLTDPRGKNLQKKAKQFMNIQIDEVRTSDIYTIDANLTIDQISEFINKTLCDPVINYVKINPEFDSTYDFFCEIGFLPGVTDNVGKTAKSALETFLGYQLQEGENIYTSTLYAFKGNINERDIEYIASELLYNPLIQQHRIYKKSDKPIIYIPKVIIKQKIKVETFDLKKYSDEELMKLSRERLLALNLEEMKTIRDFFENKDFLREREKYGLKEITDVELESLAQTWSEHCKHKIFNATIEYDDGEGNIENIKSLFKTYIKSSTELINKERKDNFLVSVFVDNAGVITFNDKYNVVFKVETHNSPSALDPYGGALTGIVGVNRDVLGTGLGAKLIFNTDIFCFADPFYSEPLPPKILHPRRIYDGVITGVEHGGNKSGIPTINGSIVFDNRYLGKPLVYCGTGGIMPKEINGKPSHEKEVKDGYLIVMSGGRIGKDGIHGATFSSEELHEGSPATAVQIGDPITQKKMADFLYIARDRGLYTSITDNGAGGLSSSVGEMAQLSGGCEIELEKAPLKYQGLQPWEILLSESQERMTLAVPPENIEEFLRLSKQYDVESTVIGKFTSTGYLHVKYAGKTVAFMPLDFLHNGLPEMKLKAKFNPYIEKKINISHEAPNELLKNLLGSLNICSKETVVRKYDHEVQAMTIIKPFVGLYNDGPSDGAIIKPLPDSYEGLVITHGICPKYSDFDTYHMAACALDEAIRNAVCCGGNIDKMACLDNFCWCDPIKSEKNPDGEHKLAQLVRANKALYDYTTSYGVPCISGKDSMKNDYIMGNIKISIPPTLLFSLIGVIEDVRKTVTMDFKNSGDIIFITGITKDELAGSELLRLLNLKGGFVPKVDAKTNKKIYKALYNAIQNGYINSAHDCSDGGFAVAVAEMAFSGGLGCEIDLERLPSEGNLSTIELLFSESAGRIIFTAKEKHLKDIEKIFNGLPFAKIGHVTDGQLLKISYKNQVIIQENIFTLKECWQKTLRDL
ncbi:MAG: phosphoribosylformylglycinamidine synthase subunit PurL [Proteobacteria bacterium]|nr:phosphoribosylformylglycinamidine synthase subunit PurL [Pseudomonadota bacterium]